MAEEIDTSIMEKIRKTNAEAALVVIHEKIPQKILDLDKLVEDIREKYANVEFTVENFSKSKLAACNTRVLELFSIIKQQVNEMIDLLGEVKLWVRLNIPKIEDGNNFGVGVQEEILVMVQTGHQSGLAVLDHITKFYFSRGRLISKSEKHPGVMDYGRAIMEMDQKQYFNLVESCKDLRNNYILLWDKITKNIDKLCKPRSENETIMIF
mmetsp:Transcript_1762/g.2382  ORF Transcript_1762/g.2382 Transcript_1762/m.2382 type:complete len:210 (+) Transcript_1762:67-696(+)